MIRGSIQISTLPNPALFGTAHTQGRETPRRSVLLLPNPSSLDLTSTQLPSTFCTSSAALSLSLCRSLPIPPLRIRRGRSFRVSLPPPSCSNIDLPLQLPTKISPSLHSPSSPALSSSRLGSATTPQEFTALYLCRHLGLIIIRRILSSLTTFVIWIEKDQRQPKGPYLPSRRDLVPSEGSSSQPNPLSFSPLR